MGDKLCIIVDLHPKHNSVLSYSSGKGEGECYVSL